MDSQRHIRPQMRYLIEESTHLKNVWGMRYFNEHFLFNYSNGHHVVGSGKCNTQWAEADRLLPFPCTCHCRMMRLNPMNLALLFWLPSPPIDRSTKPWWPHIIAFNQPDHLTRTAAVQNNRAGATEESNEGILDESSAHKMKQMISFLCLTLLQIKA